MIRLPTLLSLTILLPVASAFSQEKDWKDVTVNPTDQIVAAGIAMKTVFIVESATGEHKDLRLDPRHLKSAFATLKNDARSFSKSDFGNLMRTETDRMATNITMLLTENMPSKNATFIKLLRDNGIDSLRPSPQKMAAVINMQVHVYARHGRLPSSVTDVRTMEASLPAR